MYYYIIQLRDPLYKFFRVTGLGVNGAYPFLQRKEIQDNNTIYRYSLPVGMSTDDIQKKQLAMEQSLGKRIMIQYHRKSTFLITTINQN